MITYIHTYTYRNNTMNNVKRVTQKCSSVNCFKFNSRDNTEPKNFDFYLNVPRISVVDITPTEVEYKRAKIQVYPNSQNLWDRRSGVQENHIRAWTSMGRPVIIHLYGILVKSVFP